MFDRFPLVLSGELGLRVVAALERVIFLCRLENQVKMTQMKSKMIKLDAGVHLLEEEYNSSPDSSLYWPRDGQLSNLVCRAVLPAFRTCSPRV